MTFQVIFSVEGDPVGKQRPRFARGRTYTPKKSVDYEKLIADKAREAMASSEPLETPVAVYRQPIRKMLDLGPHDHMDKDEIAGAKRVQSALKTQRTRVGLTDDELADIWYKQSLDWMEFARAIEAAHGIKEKNT